MSHFSKQKDFVIFYKILEILIEPILYKKQYIITVLLLICTEGEVNKEENVLAIFKAKIFDGRVRPADGLGNGVKYLMGA